MGSLIDGERRDKVRRAAMDGEQIFKKDPKRHGTEIAEPDVQMGPKTSVQTESRGGKQLAVGSENQMESMRAILEKEGYTCTPLRPDDGSSRWSFLGVGYIVKGGENETAAVQKRNGACAQATVAANYVYDQSQVRDYRRSSDFVITTSDKRIIDAVVSVGGTER